MPRPTRPQTYLQLAVVWSRRSTCLRGQVGCVIVRDQRVLTAGYNGAPPGIPHCSPVECTPEIEGGCQHSVHAEANAIAFAARVGIALEGSHLYCTAGPCLKCAQLIISAGIEALTYVKPYRDDSGLQLIAEADIPAFVYTP